MFRILLQMRGYVAFRLGSSQMNPRGGAGLGTLPHSIKPDEDLTTKTRLPALFMALGERGGKLQTS